MPLAAAAVMARLVVSAPDLERVLDETWGSPFQIKQAAEQNAAHFGFTSATTSVSNSASGVEVDAGGSVPPPRLSRKPSMPGVRGCEQPGIIVKSYPIPTANAVLYVGMEPHCAACAAPDDPEDAVPSVAPGLRVKNPGNGGLRLLWYPTEADAAAEAASLAAGMSLKHRAFNTGFSGAKFVVSCADPHAVDRVVVMRAVADALQEHAGALFTGCDLNSSLEDMERLEANAPYVLAGLGSAIDPNVATGYGVAGAVAAVAARLFGSLRGRRIFVQGTGKVGGVAARLLGEAGAVMVCSDLVPGAVASAVPGAEDGAQPQPPSTMALPSPLMTHIPWYEVDCDIFVPCAKSGVIDEASAEVMHCAAVCGSANVPFFSERALRIAMRRGIHFVPEAISSAGAVLADSVEFYDPDLFYGVRDPQPVYAFIRRLCFDKTVQLFTTAAAAGTHTVEALAEVEEPYNSEPSGLRYTAWKASVTREVDFVVVGGGMAGAACAMYLATEGAGSVELLERGVVADPEGSSNGDSRMYREMQSDPFYARMQRAAMPMWRALEKESGQSLLSPNGLLFFGADTKETVEGSLKGAASTMTRLGVEHEALDAYELSERFPGLMPRWPSRPDSGAAAVDAEMYADTDSASSHSETELGSDSGVSGGTMADAFPVAEADMGLFEPGGGSVNASAAVRAFASLASKAGARITCGVRVEHITRVYNKHASRCLEVALSDDTFVRAKRRLVVAAGAWTPEVLRGLGVDLAVEIHSVAWGHYEVQKDAAPPPQWFCFRQQTHTETPLLAGLDGLYYGFPPAPGSNVAKVGVDFTPRDTAHRPATMAAFLRSPHPELAADLDAFISDHWRNMGPRVHLECSPYSMTPDGDFVLGDVPGVPGAVTFCGGNGRAFKFAPLIGACLADVTCGRAPRFNLEGRFEPSRPALRGKLAAAK